jgi:hypothetical protein
MHRFLPLLIASTLLAQTPSQSLDKPPQDIDDALRARIKQFYDYHVAGKPRRAEELVAEESKDDFYVLMKPDLKSYRIANIDYSDGFTKAKALIVGAMPTPLSMFGAKIMDMPFASFWKTEDGKWVWYYNKEFARHTPFGDLKEPQNATPGNAATATPAPPDPAQMVAMLQSALKIDKTRIDLVPGNAETVKVTNTLPGAASLSIACPYAPMSKTGITATFDKKDLKGNETAVLTLKADPDAALGSLPLMITVSPTNQVLNLTVTIARK